MEILGGTRDRGRSGCGVEATPEDSIKVREYYLQCNRESLLDRFTRYITDITNIQLKFDPLVGCHQKKILVNECNPCRVVSSY